MYCVASCLKVFQASEGERESPEVADQPVGKRTGEMLTTGKLIANMERELP